MRRDRNAEERAVESAERGQQQHPRARDSGQREREALDRAAPEFRGHQAQRRYVIQRLNVRCGVGARGTARQPIPVSIPVTRTGANNADAAPDRSKTKK